MIHRIISSDIFSRKALSEFATDDIHFFFFFQGIRLDIYIKCQNISEDTQETPQSRSTDFSRHKKKEI